MILKEILALFHSADVFLRDLSVMYGPWVYAALFAIYFGETGLVFLAFLPGDSLVFVAGAMSSVHVLNFGLTVFAMVCGAVAGNSLNFVLGRWLGNRIYDGSIRWIDPFALKKTNHFFEEHGGKTLILARFVPVVRTFAPLVAGAARMSTNRFQVASIFGAVAWVGSLALAGRKFGNLPWIKNNLSLFLLLGMASALIPLGCASLVRIIRRKKVMNCASSSL